MDKTIVPTTTPTIQRTLQVIEMVLVQPAGVSLREIVDRLGISRSSLFLILNSLKSLGYIEQSEKRGKYLAAPRLLAWKGASAAGNMAYDVLSSFYREVEERKVAETLALVVPGEEGDVVVIGQVDGSNVVKVSFSTGQHIDGGSAAGCVLAAEPNADMVKIGYSVNRTEEIYEIAVPICSNGIDPDAALLLAMPSYRDKAADLLRVVGELQEMAARISFRCGAHGYNPWHGEVPNETGESIVLEEAEIDSLMRSPWMARLACVKPDGSPHVVPVWFDWTNQKIHILAWKGSKWADYLEQNPQISLTIDEPWKPYRRISITGVAQRSLANSAEQLDALVRRIGTRYLGKRYASSTLSQADCAYSITIGTIKGWQGI